MSSQGTIVARLLKVGLILVVVLLSEIPLELTELAFGYNVIAAGDWGCNDNTKMTVNNLINKNPELVIGLGDYSYQSTADCWLTIIDPIDQK
ncbi:MAG: hypothetical protein M3247_07975, partial [Thermoproteota archaeon]|nr:hypothetical protein [Thermoproteota archaeon]